MIQNLIDLVVSGIVGYIFVQILLFFIPKNIKSGLIVWYSNRVFKSTITKFRKIIEYEQTPEQKELHDEYSFLGKHKDLIENRHKELRRFEEVQLKHVRLLEKNRYNSVVFWQLTIDWRDWVDLIDSYISELDGIVRYGVEPDFDKHKKDKIRMEEIEKRFEKLLKNE
mgnify:CR=1 FL=1